MEEIDKKYLTEALTDSERELLLNLLPEIIISKKTIFSSLDLKKFVKNKTLLLNFDNNMNNIVFLSFVKKIISKGKSPIKYNFNSNKDLLNEILNFLKD